MVRKGASGKSVGTFRIVNNKVPELSNVQGCMAIIFYDSKILYSEAIIITKGEKLLANVWLIDSQTTWHITSQRELFHKYKSI